jgi:hypothetical protein
MTAPGQAPRQGQLRVEVASAIDGDEQIPHVVPPLMRVNEPAIGQTRVW